MVKTNVTLVNVIVLKGDMTGIKWLFLDRLMGNQKALLCSTLSLFQLARRTQAGCEMTDVLRCNGPISGKSQLHYESLNDG